MLPAPTPGTPSMTSRWIPWKWIVCGWFEPAQGAEVAGAPVRQPGVLHGGLRRRGAAVQVPVGDDLVQHGKSRRGGGCAAQELAPRDFVIPQLSHEALLKHVLGATKSCWGGEAGARPRSAAPGAAEPLQAPGAARPPRGASTIEP